MLSPSRYQSAWDEKEPIPYNLDRFLNYLLLQYLFFKEIHKVLCEHQKFKPGIIPSVVVRDYHIQTKVVYASLIP